MGRWPPGSSSAVGQGGRLEMTATDSPSGNPTVPRQAQPASANILIKRRLCEADATTNSGRGQQTTTSVDAIGRTRRSRSPTGTWIRLVTDRIHHDPNVPSLLLRAEWRPVAVLALAWEELLTE